MAYDFRNPVTGGTVVLDAFWRKRKKRLESMLQHYSETAWKPGGFDIEDVKATQAKFYKHSRLGGALARRPADNEWTVKYKIIPRIQEHEEKDTATSQTLNTSDLKSTRTSEIWKHDDIVRRKGANVKYLRKYEGEVENKMVSFRNRDYGAHSKVGSLDNFYHKPGGGKVKIPKKKVKFADDAKSKIGSLENSNHTPGGGRVKILDRQVNWNAQSKVGSLDNVEHQPNGGDKLVFQEKLRWNAEAKVGSLDNIHHMPKRKFKTLYDYLPPLRKRLLEKTGVVWTRGKDQEIVKHPYKLTPFKKLQPIKQS